MNRIRWYGPTLVMLLAVLLVMIAGPRLVKNIVFAQEQAHIELASESLEQSELLSQLSNAFRTVADVVRPSVVSIQTYSKQPIKRRSSSQRRDPRFFFPPNMWPDQWRERFQQPDDSAVPDEPDRDDNDQNYQKYDPATPTGIGSGWVYDADGHIITNNHVVTSRDMKTVADKIEVHFANGDVRIAKVVGRDRDTDVAVLKVQGGHLHAMRLASEPAQQGDMVFAFGSPLRFAFSMTQGVVSGQNRELKILANAMFNLHGYENFIQTDAAINKGNSGGPLTNIRGQIIGMNTAITAPSRTGSEGFIGLGFAIPIDMVQNVADKLIRHGRVARGWLGIGLTDLSARKAKTYGYEEGSAVKVESLLDGDSPAREAGVKRNDILVKIDGQKIEDSTELRWIVANIEPGTTVAMQVFRAGQYKDLKVTLTEKPAADRLAKMRRPRDPDLDVQAESAQLLRKLGIESATPLTREMAEQFGIDQTSGVMITRVRPGSIAHAEGLGRGQVITHVMNKKVTGLTSLIETLNEFAQKHDLVRMTVVSFRRGRQGDVRDVFVEIPKD